VLVRVAIIFAGSICVALAPFTRSLGWGAQSGFITGSLVTGGLIAIVLGAVLLAEEVRR
jgi:hypothetical protein